MTDGVRATTALPVNTIMATRVLAVVLCSLLAQCGYGGEVRPLECNPAGCCGALPCLQKCSSRSTALALNVTQVIVLDMAYDVRIGHRAHGHAFEQAIIDLLHLQPSSVHVTSYEASLFGTAVIFNILVPAGMFHNVNKLFQPCAPDNNTIGCPAEQPLLDAFAANGLPATQAWYNEAPAPSSQGRRALLNATSSDTLVTQFCTCTDGWSGEYCYGHDSSTQSPVSKHLPAH